MGVSSHEDWSGLPFLSPGDLSDPGKEPRPLALAGRFFTSEEARKEVNTNQEIYFLGSVF